MTPNSSKGELSFVKSDWALLPAVRRFAHQAMGTTFEIIAQHEDARYAEQAADAAFDELDRLEAELSRYVENSDISRINNLGAGEALQIGLDAFECLKLSAKLFKETDGAFDITIGFLLRCWLDEDKTPRRPSDDELDFARAHIGTGLLKLDEARHAVELMTSPIQVDLGGMGKGYGVDRMAEMLREWSVDAALIHGGFSSVLALDGPEGTEGWPVTLSNPRDRKHILARLNLQGRAVSGSGLQKGQHIINPRTGQPVEGKIAAWSSASDAGTADALSTAFMVMDADEVERYCSNHPGVLAMILDTAGGRDSDTQRILRFGAWDAVEA